MEAGRGEMGAVLMPVNGARMRAPMPQTMREFDNLSPEGRLQCVTMLKEAVDRSDGAASSELLQAYQREELTPSGSVKCLTPVRGVRAEVYDVLDDAVVGSAMRDPSQITKDSKRRASCLFMAKRRWLKDMGDRLTMQLFFSHVPTAEPALSSNIMQSMCRLFLTINVTQTGVMTLPELDYFIVRTYRKELGKSVLFSKFPTVVAGHNAYRLTVSEFIAAVDRFCIMTRTEVARFCFDALCNDVSGAKAQKGINCKRLLTAYDVLRTSRTAHDVNEPMVVAMQAVLSGAMQLDAAPAINSGDDDDGDSGGGGNSGGGGGGVVESKAPDDDGSGEALDTRRSAAARARRNRSRKAPAGILDFHAWGTLCTREVKVLEPMFTLQSILRRATAARDNAFWDRRRAMLSLPESNVLKSGGCHCLAVAVDNASYCGRKRKAVLPSMQPAAMHPALERKAFTAERLVPPRMKLVQLVLPGRVNRQAIPVANRWKASQRFGAPARTAAQVVEHLSPEERAMVQDPDRARFMDRASAMLEDSQGTSRQLYLEPGLPASVAKSQHDARLKKLAVKFTRGEYSTWKSKTFERRLGQPAGAQLVGDYLGGPVSGRMHRQAQLWRNHLDGEQGLHAALDELEMVASKTAMSAPEVAEVDRTTRDDDDGTLVLPNERLRMRVGGARRGQKGSGRLLVTSRPMLAASRHDRHGMAPRPSPPRRTELQSPHQASMEEDDMKLELAAESLADVFLTRK